MAKHMVALSILVFCLAVAVCAQEYEQLVEQAWQKMEVAEYEEALELYRQAFQASEGDLNAYFNAACAAARAGEPDKAFEYLNKVIDDNLIEKQWLEEDEDLALLRSDSRWNDLLAALDAKMAAVAASFPDAHAEGPVVDLPQPRFSSEISVEEAMKGRRSVRAYEESPLTLAEVSQLLWAAYGISMPIENGPDFLRGGLRTAPSAGALYPLELYLAARNVTGLDPGIYWYRSETHQLVLLAGEDRWQALSEAGFSQQHFATAAAAIVYSAVFERNTETYGNRGRERYVCMDLGHSAENVYLQAYALKIGTCAIGAFNDLALKQVIGMTRAEEPLYVMPLGKVE